MTFFCLSFYGFRNWLETLFWTPRSPTPSQVMNGNIYGQNYFHYYFYDIIHIIWILVLWWDDNLSCILFCFAYFIITSPSFVLRYFFPLIPSFHWFIMIVISKVMSRFSSLNTFISLISPYSNLPFPSSFSLHTRLVCSCGQQIMWAKFTPFNPPRASGNIT